MKSKSKDLKKTVPGKNASLGRVINRNEKIKKTVKQAADELTSVNEILKEGKEVKIPVPIIKEAITQNKEVEHKFKDINDTYDHDLGDQVLLTVADRFQSAIREEDTVSRWGGDEFVCLLLEVKQEADVAHLAELIVKRISERFTFKGADLSLRVSTGIAIYPADGETADILFKNADTAMYKAKGTERRVVLFRDSVVDSPGRSEG